MVKADQGRSVTFERVPDYWARDLPTRRGQYNFDRIRIDYYRDRQIDLEAFSAYAYDFREEFTSKNWATGYDFPAVAKGWVKRATLKDETPSGAQAFSDAYFAQRPTEFGIRLPFFTAYTFVKLAYQAADRKFDGWNDMADEFIELASAECERALGGTRQ